MAKTDQEQKAKDFISLWTGILKSTKDKAAEKKLSQMFWITLLQDVYGVQNIAEYIHFEEQVALDHTSYIDGFIASTKVLIEQKGSDKNLNSPIKQSDGSLLTPFQQAKRYANELPYSKKPRWIITCNFHSFQIYDMEHPNDVPAIIQLKDLDREYYRLNFIVNEQDTHIQQELELSVEAGNVVAAIYSQLLDQYTNPTTDDLKSLNILCVRLVFCLYAEDAGLFGGHSKFHDYLAQFKPNQVRKALIDLFEILDTKPEDRDPYGDEMLNSFPYVNGGLFSNSSKIIIPRFTQELVNTILQKASEEFDWSGISPTIFGAVFESTLNPETRRSQGSHFTSIENIHKVIDPLFLDDLKDELETIKTVQIEKDRNRQLRIYQDKLASLTFMDPAAGSGNFLTETYLSLRRLENDVLGMLYGGQIMLGDESFNPIKVNIGQFYGIEINDFAVVVARTALWIAESQMLKETEKVIRMDLDFLPLKTYTNIVEANALRIDWNEVISKYYLNYIFGNPPFVANTGRVSDDESHSKKTLSEEQDKDRYDLFGDAGGLLDYVACWYKKTAIYIKGTNIHAAFVSTDSITQGQQVAPLWAPLFSEGIQINFAYRSFKWKNETNEKSATVFVVIIGFSYVKGKCLLIDENTAKPVSHINAYLVTAPDIVVEKRNKPICDVPPMQSGGKPVEGGYLIFTDKEKKEFIKKEPLSEAYFRRFTSGESFINNKIQWCLWLLDANPNELKKMPLVMERLKKVREFRLSSKKEATQKAAEYPFRFAEIKQPKSDYLLIPLTTSRNRRYVPIGYLTKDFIANNGASFVPDASLYHFGIITSNVHMSWMRAVCGYFGPSYRYSNNIVYNNFPWPDPTPEQKARIEQTAQGILNARALYPNSSLADLYDELTMPPELRTAHQNNDRAVMAAYGFPVRNFTEADCVARLMEMYQKLTTTTN